MEKVYYGIVGVIDGQEFMSKNNTREDLKNLVAMIVGFGGWVVEILEEIF